MVECFALRHRETVGGGAGELQADTDHCARFVDMQGFELCQRQLNLLGGQIHGLPTDHAARTGGLRSEEHTSELQSLMRISYAVFCLKKKKKLTQHSSHHYLSTRHLAASVPYIIKKQDTPEH